MLYFTKISLIYYVCHCIVDIVGLKLTEISIPDYVDRYKVAQLSCKFEISSGKLYSVKWYKDEFEFFRFLPDNTPQMTTFPVNGVDLDIGQSNKTTVTLRQLSSNSTGKYRCEVSKEAPNFQTVGRTKEMKVIDFPKELPDIRGLRDHYSVNDTLNLTCISSPSNPVSNLFWLINNRTVEDRYLRYYDKINPVGSLYTKSLGLKYFLSKDVFSDKTIELRCRAVIGTLRPWDRTKQIPEDEPTHDGIFTQAHKNRVNNNSNSLRVELLNALMATISLYCLYFVYQ